ncbi:MAG: IPT/TIG domain-containing protein [Melioribacteraceae bacterium]|nr:IPT/TIG domain-containing protein [Melioribacteraceae bacterium]
MKKNNLQKWIIKNTLLVLLALSVVFVIGCEDDSTNNPYEENANYAGDGSGQPVVSQISPVDGAIAGVTEVTITGSNFLDSEEKLMVSFGGAEAEIISTSKTEIKVKAPNLIGDQLTVRVGTDNELWSDIVYYDLKPAFTIPNAFSKDEEVFAVAVNSAEEIFVSMKAFNAGVGIKKFSEGTKPVAFALKGGETFWNDLKFGKNDTLIGVYGVRALFKLLEGEKPSAYTRFASSSYRVSAFDFDKDGVIWVGGSAGMLFSVQPDGTITEFEFAPVINAVKVYDGYLYLAIDDGSEKSVKRFVINSSTELGTEETYFAFSNVFEYALNDINAITFSNDGDMYLATNQEDPILTVHSNGTYEPLYTGILQITPNLEQSVISLYWGNDKFLYATYTYKPDAETQLSTIFKIDMQKLGAPQHGRD